MTRLILVFLLAGAVYAQNDFAAARWVLRQGGRVRLVNDARIYDTLRQLPATAFRVEAVDLIGASFNPDDLKNLSTLTELKELLLPGPIFNPGAGSTLDANAEFQALAGLTKIEKLHFSLHFLTNVNVQDKGLSLLKGLTGMRELRLAQTRVKGPSLAAFAALEKLDLNYTTFPDDGLKHLAGMPRLNTLYLRDTLVTDKGMVDLAKLTSLEHLDLSGARLTDAGVRQLGSLTRLKSLNLLGAQITDESVPVLAAMPALEELNVYRSQISNAGLKKLESLKKLRHLDLRYTRVSRAGLESFAKAVPACQTEFMDQAAGGAQAALRQTKPAAATGAAVAEWVMKLGGSAHFREGRLDRVDLSRTPVSEEQLAHLTALPIEELRLDSTEFGDAGMARLPRTLRRLNLAHTAVSEKSLGALPAGLEQLDLSNTGLGDAASALVPAGLTSLNMAYSAVTNAGVKEMAARLTRLQTLDLTSTDIENDALTALATVPTLRDLRISYGRYTDKGIAALAALPQLERLEMVRTRLTDAGLKSLAALTGLKTLRIDYTNVSDAGLTHIPAGIEELRLDTANVSDAGVETLMKMKRLKLLNLYHTTVTEKGYARLKEALPECQIIYDRDSAIPIRRKS